MNEYGKDEYGGVSSVEEELPEPIKELSSFFRKRDEKDKKAREKAYGKHGKLIWDSTKNGTYRKSRGETMGIDGIEQLSGNDSDSELVVTDSSLPVDTVGTFACNPDEVDEDTTDVE